MEFPARGFAITYETPRSEKLQLFHLGERTFDHVLFMPTKVKGKLGKGGGLQKLLPRVVREAD